MIADKCSRSNEALLRQMRATQNVIKNKFRTACALRREHDRDANQTLQSLTTTAKAHTTLSSHSSPQMTITNETVSKKSAQDFSHRKQSKNTTLQSSGLTIKSNSKNMNVDELCIKLRILIHSHHAYSLHRMREISLIVNKLRELKAIL